MARIDLQTLEEARVAYAALYDAHETLTAEHETLKSQALEKDGEIAKLQGQNHELFLKIPMVDKTEEPNANDGEPEEMTTEEFAHSIADKF